MKDLNLDVQLTKS